MRAPHFAKAALRMYVSRGYRYVIARAVNIPFFPRVVKHLISVIRQEHVSILRVRVAQVIQHITVMKGLYSKPSARALAGGTTQRRFRANPCLRKRFGGTITARDAERRSLRCSG